MTVKEENRASNSAHDEVDDSGYAKGGDAEPLLGQNSSGTSAAKSPYHASLWWVMVIGFIVNSDISINLPSLDNYVNSLGGSSFLYGISISAFSLSQVVISAPLGWWFDKRSAREVMFCMLIVCGAGNFIYALAAPLDMVSLILVGRVVAGLGAGIMAVNMAYITRVTTKADRTATMARYTVFSLTALILAPGLSYFLAFSSFTVAGMPINPYTAPAIFMTILCVAAAFAAAVGVKEPPVAVAEADPSATRSVRRLPMRVVLSILLFFINSFELSAFQTLAPILTRDYFSWETQQNDFLFIAIGVTAALSTVLVLRLSRVMRDSTIFCCGQAVLLAGMLLSVRYAAQQYQLAIFCTAAILISAGLALSIPILPSIFSKAIEEALGKNMLGSMMGWLNASNNVARILGPLWTAFAVRFFLSESSICQWGLVGLCLASLILSIVFLRDAAAMTISAGKSAPGKTRASGITPV